MSCNGCRVLRKGCSESCILRPCLQWIEGPEAQGHATVFVAKFFGRAGLMSFISSVPVSQRPALFQSLLFEACGRTVNPVNGAVGLLWTGQWHLCQAAVETVLRGGTLRAMTDAPPPASPESDEAEESCTTRLGRSRTGGHKKKCTEYNKSSSAWKPQLMQLQAGDLDLRLTAPGLEARAAAPAGEKRRPSSPSEGSVTTSAESDRDAERKLLNLFI